MNMSTLARPCRCVLVFVVAGMLSAGGMVRAGEGEVIESRGSFESQGKSIAIERFEPKVPGKYPAVLVIHGAGGMAIGGPWFRDSARHLAKNGYVAHVVHYFDLTGTTIADPSVMKTHFPSWMKVLADGLTSLGRQPNVDADRLGLVGFSLGSYLSLAVALYDVRVLCVVEYFGGLPAPLIESVKTLPPILILHGDADKVVPVSEAKTLETLCRDRKFNHEVHIYPGAGHGFFGDTNLDALQCSRAFLDTHLKYAELPRQKRETSRIPRPEKVAKLVGGA